METLKKSAPKLVEDLTPKTLPLAVVVRVLQNLLAEKVPVRQIRQIAEAPAATGAARTRPVQPVGTPSAANGSQDQGAVLRLVPHAQLPGEVKPMQHARRAQHHFVGMRTVVVQRLQALVARQPAVKGTVQQRERCRDP